MVSVEEGGKESFLLSSTIRGILAQRLVRIICPQCREKDASSISLEELAPFGVGAEVSTTRVDVKGDDYILNVKKGKKGSLISESILSNKVSK